MELARGSPLLLGHFLVRGSSGYPFILQQYGPDGHGSLSNVVLTPKERLLAVGAGNA